MKTPKSFFRYGLVILVLVAAGLLLFPGFARGVFSSEGFMPHYTCYMNNPRMVWLHVASDMFIGLAYVCISSTLAYLVWRANRDIPFHWMFLAFGLFIVSCGFTHFMEVITVWHAVYWLAGYVKVITAVASVTTAVALFPLVPKIFATIDAVKISEERRVEVLDANRELEAFASSISHDLRAPLRTMQGMAVALKVDYASQLDATAQDYAGKIVIAAERMDQLIQDLLAYSRMNLDQFELERVDVKAVIEEVTVMIAANIQERNATVTLEGTFGAAKASPALLNQVISNLLVNAIKFTKPGVKPQVTVRGEVTMTSVRIYVKDNGIGIAPEHQQQIFKMFERLHTVSEYPGTGVGLAIVQRAMARMGGSLGLESEPGKGSCFWIDLPNA
jgi:signal transduction histidine kinase